MKHCFQLLIFSVLAAVLSPSFAEAPRYSYVSAEYFQFSSTIEGISEKVEGDGMYYQLSHAVMPYIALTAGYRKASSEFNSSGTMINTDAETTTYGLQVHLPINTKADLVLAVDFFNGGTDVNKDGSFVTNVGHDGGVTSLGVRAMAYDNLELKGFMHKNSVEGDSRIGLSMGAAYFVTRSVSVGLDYYIDSDDEFLNIGISKYY